MTKKTLLIGLTSFAILFGAYLLLMGVFARQSESVARDVRDIQQITSNRLLPAVSKYNTESDTSKKAALLQQTVDLSRTRKEKMLELIRKDPSAALNIAMPDVQRAALPAEAQSLVEEQATIEDTLSVNITDDFEADRATIEYGVGEGTEAVQLHLAEPDQAALGEAAQTTVRVSGVKLDQHLAVPASGNPIQIAGAGGAATGTSSDKVVGTGGTGTKKLAVIAVTFPDKTDLGFTMDQVKREVFGETNSAKAYLGEMSFGKMTITGSTFGPYRLTMNGPDKACAWNDREKWLAEAKSIAQSKGVSFSGYTNYIVVAPKGSKCSGSGTGQIRGTKIFMNGSWTSWYTVFGHELGHNFGEWHSSSLSCTLSGKRVPFGGTCTSSEYGDRNSMMGYNYTHRHITTSQKGQIGILKPENTRTITTDGTYTVVPSEKASSGIQSLRIKLKNAFSAVNSQGGTEVYPYYYFEFHQPFGFNNYAVTDPYVKGVSIRLGGDYAAAPIHTQLLDMTPTTTTFDDAPLAAGKSYKFPDGFTIKVNSVGPTGASIQVTGLGAAPTPGDTSAPSAPQLSGKALGQTSIALNWTASTDNIGVVGYDVYRNDAKIASVNGTTLTYTNTGLSVGTTYHYHVKARDAAGNVGTSATVVITTTSPVADPIPPTVPTGLRVSSVTASQVNLAWTASTDNSVLAGYEILRNGTKIGTATGTSFGDGGLTAGTTYVYTVVAYDAAGNRSAASAQVSATTTAPTAQTGSLTGYVHTYTNPKPIMGAVINLFKSSSGSLYRTAITNAQGTFALNKLPAEEYVMEVRYSGKLVLKRTITITAGKTRNWDIWIY